MFFDQPIHQFFNIFIKLIVSYTTADLNLTWYKAGVYLNDVDLQNFVARIDELVHFEMSKSDGRKQLQINLYICIKALIGRSSVPQILVKFMMSLGLKLLPEGNLVTI